MHLVLRADRIDDLHNEISDIKEPFPYSSNFDTCQYFNWLDKKLEANDPPLACINIADSWGDDMLVILVYREDTERILELYILVKVSHPKKGVF
ncbi:MAG: hypothetical protein ABI237_05010 [Ginsengibacter sp.]